MDQSNDQDVARLQERVSLLEFEASRRDVVDRIRTVIQGLPDDDYKAVLEAISEALSELCVSYEYACVHVLDGDQHTQYLKGSTGWFQSTPDIELQLIRH